MHQLLTKKEITLQLIKEELKSRKFFNALLDLGLDNCPYQSNLDDLIMNFVGLNDDADETFDFYYDVMDRHGKLITANKESIGRQALEAYDELMVEIKRRESKGL
ncbi:MAG TPA: hypothetical protein VL443_27360 [Cyclobacteriaceae bacterium]|nr:hypothetical protein [Cyclobacteriaceae bacterium]